MKVRPMFCPLGVMRRARIIECRMASERKLHASPHDFHTANQLILPGRVTRQTGRQKTSISPTPLGERKRVTSTSGSGQ